MPKQNKILAISLIRLFGVASCALQPSELAWNLLLHQL
jgi:hypothetical protein